MSNLKRIYYDEKWNNRLEITAHIDHHMEEFSIQFDNAGHRENCVENILKDASTPLENRLNKLKKLQKEQAAKPIPKSQATGPIYVSRSIQEFDIEDDLVKDFLKENYAAYENYEWSDDDQLDIKEALKQITAEDYKDIWSSHASI